MSSYGKILNIALGIVQEASALIVSRSIGRQPFSIKENDTDLLTETDTDIEEILICGLSKAFPEHKFISEERHPNNKELTNRPTWLIDPVDGTMNFVHGFPHCCISIALLVQKETQIGIIYNALLRQKFTALKGQGAFFNDRRMNVSGEKCLSHALIATELCSRDEEKFDIVKQNIAKFCPITHGFRSLGSAALNLAMLAAGGVDANYEMGIHSWDIAAGELMVREAGGVVIDPSGGPFDLMSRKILAASSMELAKEIAEYITEYNAEPRDN